MAIAFDAASASSSGTGELSWTHTPVGTPSGIAVLIAQEDVGTDDVSGVTYGGTSMVRALMDSKASGETGRVYIYKLGSSISSGAQTVVVSVTGSDKKRASAISMTASADTEEEQSGSVTADELVDPAVTLANGGGVETYCMGVLYSGRGDVSHFQDTADYTQVFFSDWGADSGQVISRTSNATGGNEDVAWDSFGVSDDTVAGAISIKESAGGAAVAILLRQPLKPFIHNVMR